ncbi:MAG: hypothetical protein ABGZ17_26925, partial [Planctomycetaceae bacterium]
PSLRIEYQPQDAGSAPPTILDSGSARTNIWDSDGTGIGLGDAVVIGGLNLSGDQIENIRASELTLNTAGAISVQNLSESDTDGIPGTFRLSAEGAVVFDAGPSVFNVLTVESSTRVDVDVAVTTDAGALTILADASLTGSPGDLMVSSTGSLSTDHAPLVIVANDLDLNGSISVGTSSVEISDSNGPGMGLGTSSIIAGLNVDGDELARISAGQLKFTSGGELRVGGVNITHVNGSVELTAGDRVTFDNAASFFNAILVAGGDGVDVQVALNSLSGGVIIDADADPFDDDGTLAVAAGAVIDSNGAHLTVTANDLDLSGVLLASGSSIELNDSDGTGIGLGAAIVPAGINLSSSELALVSGDTVTLRTSGNLVVDGLDVTATDNVVGNVILETGDSVRIQNGPSVFGAVTLNANDGVQFETSIETVRGDLRINSDANGLAEFDDGIRFASGVAVRAAGSLILDSRTPMTADGSLVLSAGSDLVIHDDLSALGATLLHADSDADRTGTLHLESDVTIDTSGFDLTIRVDDLALATGSGTNSGAAETRIETSSVIDIGLGAVDPVALFEPLLIDATEVNALLTTGQLTIGSTTSGRILVHELDVGSRDFALISGSTIDDDGDGTSHLSTAGTLTLQSSAQIGDVATSGIEGLNVSAASVIVSGVGGGDLQLTNHVALDASYLVSTSGSGIRLVQLHQDLLVDVIDDSGGSVVLIAETGGIEDLAADSRVNIFADSVLVSAATGVGQLDAFELQTEQLAANATTGGVNIQNQALDTLVVTNVTAVSGDVVLSQVGGQRLELQQVSVGMGLIDVSNSGGELLVIDLVSSGVGHQVTLRTIGSGSATIGSVVADGNSVRIESAGAIDENVSDDATSDIVADTLELQAVLGIGGLRGLDVTAANLEGETVAGGIDLQVLAVTAVSVGSLQAGAGNIALAQTGNRELVIHSAVADSGSISIDLQSGQLLKKKPAEQDRAGQGPTAPELK